MSRSVAWCALRQICAPSVSRKKLNAANVFSNKTFLKNKTDISSEQIEIGNHSNSLSNQSHQSDFASIISDPIEHINNRIDQSRNHPPAMNTNRITNKSIRLRLNAAMQNQEHRPQLRGALRKHGLNTNRLALVNI